MNDFVTIATYGSPAEAAVMKGKLEAHDIFCYLADEHSISANPMYSVALGGVKLRVREEEKERALEILDSSADELTTESTLDDGDKICPKCNSNNTQRVQMASAKWWNVLVSLLLAVPVPVQSKRHHCFHCGNEWEE